MATQHRFNVDLLSTDMTVRGWNPKELARQAEIADVTVYRFLSGERQTAKTLKKLADAMGYSVRRYLLSARKGVAA